MDNLAELIVKVPTEFNRDYLKRISKDMVRKDFELLRVQDCFLNIFSEADIFSNPDDELSSVQHCLELASGVVVENSSEDTFWGLVSDSSIALAFDYKRGSSDHMEQIKKNVDIFVDLIFKACEMENESEKQYLFIEGFCINFPKLEVPFLKRRGLELVNVRNSLKH